MITDYLVSCIYATTMEEFKNQAVKKETGFIEHRLDLLEDLSSYEIDYSVFSAKTVVTILYKEDGGNFEGSYNDYCALLGKAISYNPTYIDISFQLPKEKRDALIEVAHENDIKVIISHHNIHGTPELTELRNLILEMYSTKADVVKYVSQANTLLDCHNIITLQIETMFPLISFCLGEMGKYTRVVSLLYGAPFTYVAMDRKVASGQFTYNEFLQLFEKLAWEER